MTVPPAARRLALLLAVVAGGCAPSPRAAPRATNLVVVMVDTLRADHLAQYGYARTTTPVLDRWAAAAGVVFENARSQAPCTFPSVNSLLTSRAPTFFLESAGAAGSVTGIPAATPSLAVRLRGAGFRTAAVSASPIVRASPSAENPSGGFDAGFERFDEFCYWREARCVSQRARDLLPSLAPPFLLYLHYLDPHDPYRLPEGAALAPRFAGAGPAGAAKQFVREGDPRPIAEHLYAGGPDPGLEPGDLAHMVDLYDDEILYWDREFAPLAVELRERFPDTAFVVVSDHGEEFLEHDHVKHCRSLFDTELRVPLILFAPGVRAARVAAPVSNLDVLPTLLELAGVPAKLNELEGSSLLALLAPPAGALPQRLQLATNGWSWAAAQGRYKLILEPEYEREGLYDLVADPGERQPLAGVDAERERLRGLLARWRAEGRRAAEGAREVEKQLRAAGYLQ